MNKEYQINDLCSCKECMYTTAVGVDRTPDLSIFSAALSQLSYNGGTIGI